MGKKSADPGDAGDIMIGDETWTQDSELSMNDWTYMESKLGVGYTDDVHPGKKTRTVHIYRIDAGDKPTAILIGDWLIFSTSK